MHWYIQGRLNSRSQTVKALLSVFQIFVSFRQFAQVVDEGLQVVGFRNQAIVFPKIEIRAPATDCVTGFVDLEARSSCHSPWSEGSEWSEPSPLTGSASSSSFGDSSRSERSGSPACSKG